MSLYRICGIILESDYSFPELLSVDRGCADCTFSLQGPRPAAEYEWFHRRVDSEEEVWMLLGKSESEYVLRFPELAEFEVSNDGRSVRCYPAPALPSDTLSHLLIDQVIPLLLTLHGEVVLHSSAVRGPTSAAAFIGKSGSGKSTLPWRSSDSPSFPTMPWWYARLAIICGVSRVTQG